MKSITRPEVNLFLMAYLSLLGLGGLFGGLLVFVTAIPAIQEMGPFFGRSVAIMAVLGIFALLLAALAAVAMIGLWRETGAGRALTMILTIWMLAVSGISVPVLLLVGLDGIALSVPLITAVFLFISSGGALWALTHGNDYEYFGGQNGR